MNDLLTSPINFSVILPVVSLALAGFVVLGVGIFMPKPKRTLLFGISLVGILISSYYTVQLWDQNGSAFGGLVVADNFALTFNLIFLLGAGLCVLMSMNSHERGYLLYTEFFAVLLFATVGMLLMAGSTHLLIMFLGLETLSISLYILAGLKRTEALSLESAFKYFLLGAFSSGFLLYGIAFIYGANGSFDLQKIAVNVASVPLSDNLYMILGGVLIVVGLGFKIAIAPFHMWAPDVYQGAPTPVTAFMATGSKAAGFAALLRVVFSATDGAVPDWTIILWVLAVLTMSVGNLAALGQTNIKRMLAYSSVAHAGYTLVGIVAWNELGASSVIFYLLSYTFMNIGAFAIISMLSTEDGELLEFNDFKGLANHRPLVAVMMALFMFSLAGLPPTAGFVGKFYLFTAAVKAGHIPLVVIAVINSMISLYYYLSVVVVMFMKKSDSDIKGAVFLPTVSLTLALAMLGTLGLGGWPTHFMQQFQDFVGRIM
ncbi:MAG: NADH-quinone oxidoreductase subunit N [bacterium]